MVFSRMPLDEVRSEGLRQWNMDMEYQYETFNGLPVYYGGDVYEAEDWRTIILMFSGGNGIDDLHSTPSG